MSSGARAVLISAENLSNGANFQFFNKILPSMDCKVILYIRRQDELLTSSWQQWHSKVETDINAWLILALQQYGHWLRCIDMAGNRLPEPEMSQYGYIRNPISQMGTSSMTFWGWPKSTRPRLRSFDQLNSSIPHFRM